MAKKLDTFKDFVLDQLTDMRDLECRAMFGGFGMYSGSIFFGIVFKSRLYFKTTDRTRSRYIQAGMKPFQPSQKQTLKNYYEVPADTIENAERLIEWAQEAVNV